MWRALGLLLAAHAAACTIILPELATGSNFAVTFCDPGRAVAGLRVALRGPDGRAIAAAATTDAAGLARFRGVPRGRYSLGDGEAGFGDLALLAVGTRPHAALKDMAVDWPGDWRDPVAARGLHGSIRAAYTLPSEERSLAAELDIFDGANGRLLRTLRLAPGQRQFDLRALPPGRYALALRQSPEGKQLGPVLVEVNPRAPAGGFDLVLGAWDCGTWVHNRATCPQAPLRLSRLAGRVVDATRAPLPGATVLLLDAAEAELARVRTDDQGRFALPIAPRAGFTLAIYRLGFTPLRAGIEDVTDSGALAVELGVLGACGQIAVQ